MVTKEEISSLNLSEVEIILICFCFVDKELHFKERDYLKEQWQLGDKDINKVSEFLIMEKDPEIYLRELLVHFSGNQEDKNILAFALKEIAWADGKLHQAEKNIFRLIKKEWNLTVLDETSEWRPTNEQKKIIEAPSHEWLRVSAKPGTGKTATACARVSYLIEKGIQPSKIWMMSFTRTAIREISTRVKDLSDSSDDLSRETAMGIKISTIDSEAGKIRYGFTEKEVKNFFGDHNVGLKAASKILKKGSNEFRRFLDINLEHLILDEAQDITDERAHFIKNLLMELNDDCGVTIFEDPAQAIYEAEDTNLSVELKSSGIDKHFKEVELTKFHRTNNPELLDFIEKFHDQAAFKLSCTPEDFKKMDLKIEDISNKNLGEFNAKDIVELEQEFNNSLVLFRQRGQVLRASYNLGEAKGAGIQHRIRMGRRGAPLFPWIAYLFWDREEDTIEKAEFSMLWRQKSPHPWLEDLDDQVAWKNLFRYAPFEDKELLDLKKLRKFLSRKSVDPEFCNPDLGLWGPILGTIHGSKGREANHVAYFKSSSIPKKEEKRNEEARIMYVAASRPKGQLRVGVSENKFFPKLGESERIYKKQQNSIQIEVGLEGDYDSISLVDRNFYIEEEEVIMIQNELINCSHPDKKIPSLQAVRLDETKNWAYEIRFQKGNYEKISKLGKFNNVAFKNDLFEGSKKIKQYNKTPRILKSFHLIGCATGVMDPSDRNINYLHSPFNKSGFWLYPIVSGFPFYRF